MTKHKYGRPKKRNLNQERVAEFLRNLDFEIESISQEWRHLHAFGKFEGKDAVFKLASTQVTSKKTQNEYRWNEAVHLVPDSIHPNFTVPENYSSGSFGKLFYFITERFMEEPLVKRNSNDLSRVIQKVPQIAKATYELEHLPIPPGCEFVKIAMKKRKKQILPGERLLQSATEWANQVPLNLNKFLSIIEKKKNDIRTCVGHGDFVIRQMYNVNGKIGIIDGEHAGLKGPLYLDAAQFYIRLRNDFNVKCIAQKYLKEFKKLLTPADKQNFWEELKPVLIQRFIGDIWWVAKKPKKIDALMILGQEILKDKIFPT